MAGPLSPDRLLSALRAEGLKVVEYKSWRVHRRPASTGSFGPINGVMIHHTVTSGTASSVALCYNGHSALPGPLCHGVIAKDGTVHLVSAGRANHAGKGDDDVLATVRAESYDRNQTLAPNEANTDGNRHFYGFECVNLGDGKDPWPAAQRDAVVRASAAVLRAYGGPDKGWTARSVIGHKEWQPGKIDPRTGQGGVDVAPPVLRHLIDERLTHSPSWSPDDETTAPSKPVTPTVPAATPEEDPMPAPLMLAESNPIDVALASGTWTGLALKDAVLHTGPRRHHTVIGLLFADDLPNGTTVEGRFYLTDTSGKNKSDYLPDGPHPLHGGGHHFACTSDVPAGRHLRFEVRATTPDGSPVTLLHRSASGPHWAI